MQAFVKKKGQKEWSKIKFIGVVRNTRQTDDSGFADFVFDIPGDSTKLKLQVVFSIHVYYVLLFCFFLLTRRTH